MTPERVAALVSRWVRLYTRNLPAPVGERRVDEIDADLHDHIAHERATGTSDRRIALGILSRMLHGVLADVAWRERQAKLAARGSAAGHSARPTRTLRRSAARVAGSVALVLSLPLLGMLVSDGVAWSAADFALAGVLLATIGIALELAVRRAGGRLIAVALAVLGVAASLLGETGDAPGLVLLGIVLVTSAIALGVRAAQHGR